eukprot:3279211-Heterocapsa_arctica.AAC.1
MKGTVGTPWNPQTEIEHDRPAIQPHVPTPAPPVDRTGPEVPGAGSRSGEDVAVPDDCPLGPANHDDEHERPDMPTGSPEK